MLRQLQAVQQQLRTAGAAARQQAHRVSGLLLVARDSGSEAVYKVGGQDNNGFPYYKHIKVPSCTTTQPIRAGAFRAQSGMRLARQLS